MRKFTVGGLALVCALALTTAPAGAATKKKTTPFSAESEVTAQPVDSAGRNVFGGSIAGSLGSGTVSYANTVNGNQITSEITVRLRGGTLTSTATGTSDPVAEGVNRFRGSGKIASGTGKYKGATGSFSYGGYSASGTVYLFLSGKLVS